MPLSLTADFFQISFVYKTRPKANYFVNNQTIYFIPFIMNVIGSLVDFYSNQYFKLSQNYFYKNMVALLTTLTKATKTMLTNTRYMTTGVWCEINLHKKQCNWPLWLPYIVPFETMSNKEPFYLHKSHSLWTKWNLQIKLRVLSQCLPNKNKYKSIEQKDQTYIKVPN